MYCGVTTRSKPNQSQSVLPVTSLSSTRARCRGTQSCVTGLRRHPVLVVGAEDWSPLRPNGTTSTAPCRRVCRTPTDWRVPSHSEVSVTGCSRGRWWHRCAGRPIWSSRWREPQVARWITRHDSLWGIACALRALCWEFIDIFDTAVRPLPAKVDAMVIEIDRSKWELPQNRLPQRSHSAEKQQSLRTQVDALLQLGVIEEPGQPIGVRSIQFASPMAHSGSPWILFSSTPQQADWKVGPSLTFSKPCLDWGPWNQQCLVYWT